MEKKYKKVARPKKASSAENAKKQTYPQKLLEQTLLMLTAFLLLFPSPATAKATAKTKESGNIFSEEAKKRFSKAQPEDITNENFPELIESFDYPNADISEIVKAISKLTGKNFIIDPGASRGKITIIAPSQITVAEAYRAFLSALAMNGLTIVPSGSFLKIRPARSAQTDSIETYTDYFPNTDQIITRIIKLKYISAEEVDKKIRILKSKDGQMSAYGPTNSLILTDYGSNIQRVVNILSQLDVPGFEEQLTVIRIQHAKAKAISDLIDQIINKGKQPSATGRFSSVPRFRRRRNTRNENNGSQRGAESYSLVVADERSNSIIVMGNKAGLARIRKLVKKLDFPIRPEDAGGVHVYYVKYGEAEKISTVLNGLTSSKSSTTSSKSRGSRSTPSSSNSRSGDASIFGGNVKVSADKDTNSLIITASKQDYQIVQNLLAKIDIQRDQVFVKTIIMEMNATRSTNWGISYFKFDENSNGLGRIGFGGGNLSSLLNPAGTAGAVLSFGSSKLLTLPTPNGPIQIADLMGFVTFLKTTVGVNILSAPQITALDNEEAIIEVGQDVPIGASETIAPSGASTTSIQRKKATIKLVITPFISPDTDSVRMNISQDVVQVAPEQIKGASKLADSSIVTNDRSIKTSIIVDSGDTAVLGGLMQDVKTDTVVKVPILGDLPILGWLFKSHMTEKQKRNLVVFITPQIIRNRQNSNKILDKKLEERLNFLQTSMNGKDPHGYFLDTLPRKPQLGELPNEDEVLDFSNVLDDDDSSSRNSNTSTTPSEDQGLDVFDDDDNSPGNSDTSTTPSEDQGLDVFDDDDNSSGNSDTSTTPSEDQDLNE